MLIDSIDAEEIRHWTVINDDVMSGISESRTALSSAKTMLFCGQLALENNGGFASIYRRSENYNLKACTGVILKVKGDGRRYQFRVKTNAQHNGIAYKTLFSTETDQWQRLTLPFGRFSASFRGKAVPDAPVLQPEHIKQIGFLLADKQPGSFCLEIACIKSY